MLQRLRHSRRITHRRLVVNFLNTQLPGDQQLFRETRLLLLEAALDADEDVRELALGLLQGARDPEVPRLAQALAADADPDARMQGLRFLQRAGGPQFL